MCVHIHTVALFGPGCFCISLQSRGPGAWLGASRTIMSCNKQKQRTFDSSTLLPVTVTLQWVVTMVHLRRLLRKIEDGYIDSNPYHNKVHAAGVLQTLHVVVHQAGMVAAQGAMWTLWS